MENLRTQPPQVQDSLTGLPWSESASEEIAAWAEDHAVHAICVHLIGLGKLASLQERRGSPSVMSEVARRLSGLMGPHDRFTRHSGNKFMIFSTRPRDEVETLVDAIRRQIAEVSVEVEGQRMPSCRIGVATLSQAEDHGNAYATVDALMTSAEMAAGFPAAHVAPPVTQVAPPVAQVPPPVAQVPPPVAQTAPPVAQVAPPVAQVPPPVAQVAPPVAQTAPPAVRLEPEAPRVETSVPAERNGKAPAVDLPQLQERPVLEQRSPVRASAPISTSAERSAEERVAIMNPQPTRLEPQVTTAGGEPRVDVPAGFAAQPWEETDLRLMLTGTTLDVTGLTATATVDLMLGRRGARGKAVDRNTPDRRLYLVGEAAARAITELLPKGFGVALRDVHLLPTDHGKILVAIAQYLSPMGDEFLFGVAPISEETADAIARALLSAVNRRVGPMLVTS